MQKRSLKQRSLVGLLASTVLGACGGQTTLDAAGGLAGASASGGQSAIGSGGAGTGGGVGAGTSADGSGTGGRIADSLVQPLGTYECEPGIPATPARRLLNWQYDNTVRDLLGVTGLTEYGGEQPSHLLLPDYEGPLNTYSSEAYRLVARAIAEQVMADAALTPHFLACDPEQDSCLEDTIVLFGRKAFRRPLSEGEAQELAQLIPADLAGQGAQAATEILAAILNSPHFIEREIVVRSPDAFELTGHELAARLSYFIWGSTPDDILSAAADADELVSSEQVEAQIQRLLAAPQASDGIEHAFRHYLLLDSDTSYWFSRDHDRAKYPLFTAGLMAASREELLRFTDSVTVSGGTFSDLFLSAEGFVNADLAAVYGLNPGDFGPELEPVALDPEARPGLLTRVAFLASFSNSASTAPMIRGGYLLTRGFGLELPPPPAEPIGSAPPDGEYQTNRQYTEALTSPRNCQECHALYVNPFGFALENYDAIGSWQTVDPLGGPIDPLANVFVGDDIVPVSTPREVMELLAASKYARYQFAEELVSFAFERPPSPEDDCLVDELALLLEDDELPLLALWTKVASSALFRLGAPAAAE